MANLLGKVAVVSGASKGIGAAIAQRLAADGAAVIVNYAKAAGDAEKIAGDIKAAGGKAKAIQADLSKVSGAQQLIGAALSEFGQIDILVNNAGIYEFVPLLSATEDHFNRIFDLNVKGLLFATQAAVKALDGRGGSIINIGSLVSLGALANGSVYSASKAAVDSITKSLATELGPKNIRVNAVLPGPVDTEGARALENWDDFRTRLLPQTPLGRVGEPRDIAGVVSFLASSDAGWITGQVISAAGGLRV